MTIIGRNFAFENGSGLTILKQLTVTVHGLIFGRATLLGGFIIGRIFASEILGAFFGGSFLSEFYGSLVSPQFFILFAITRYFEKKTNKQTNKKQTSQSLCLLCTNTS